MYVYAHAPPDLHLSLPVASQSLQTRAVQASDQGPPLDCRPKGSGSLEAGENGVPFCGMLPSPANLSVFQDAGMRQLNATGWMHNRARMITASFLSKHLLLDWRLGERYFSQQLIDLDFASNNGGWQWASSTGTDSQPYFRVFNPMRQAERFDKSAEYVKRWVPELKKLSSAQVIEPSKLGAARMREIGYVMPVVEHTAARKRAIDAFKNHATAAAEDGVAPASKKQRVN